MALETKLMKVTPSMAANWMEKNKRNRKISTAHVEKLAYALIGEEWQVNGESIKFDTKGNLIDGQHRLMAIIESGVAMRTYVISGLNAETFKTIDTGRGRTAGDTLSVEGAKHSTTLATAARHVYFSQLSSSWNGYLGGGKKYKKMSNTAVLEIVEEHPGLVKHVERAHESDRSQCRKMIGAGPLAFATYWCSVTHDEDELLEEFMVRLEYGDRLERNDPVYQLRHRLQTMLMDRNTSQSARRERLSLFFKAWNKFRRHETCSLLKVSSQEGFVTPDQSIHRRSRRHA